MRKWFSYPVYLRKLLNEGFRNSATNIFRKVLVLNPSLVLFWPKCVLFDTLFSYVKLKLGSMYAFSIILRILERILCILNFSLNRLVK